MISKYHNHDRSPGPDMVPVKNPDGTFTICEYVFRMKLGRSEIIGKVKR